MLDLALSIEARACMGRSAFNPASLFVGGALGGYYDPTDLSTLYQTGTRAAPGAAVSAATDPVGLMLDKSGNNNDLTQGTAANRPTYQTTSGFGQLLFDGTNDKMIFPINMLSGWTSGTGLFGAKIAVDPPAAQNGPVLGYFSETGATDLYPFTDGIVYNGFMSTVRKTCGDPGNLAAWHAADFRSAANSFIAGFNGTDYFTTATNTVAVTTGVAGYPTLGDDGHGIFFNGRVGRVIVINRILSGAELASARTWVGAGSGLSI